MPCDGQQPPKRLSGFLLQSYEQDKKLWSLPHRIKIGNTLKSLNRSLWSTASPFLQKAAEAATSCRKLARQA